ncbi:MAG: rhodanese-like domain-containing protein [Methylococcales bacterium]
MDMKAVDFVKEAKANIIEVDINQAKKLLAENALVLDVREPNEYATGYIANAVNIPRGVLEFKINQHIDDSDKSVSILVYCKTGGRGALAVNTLKLMGYKQVVSLQGGIDNWVSAGNPIEK